MQIDINCDLGEGADDAAFMPLITSANIACGGHAGDERTMRHAVQLAIASEVSIGAHPGYEDRVNFGRTEMHVPSDLLRHSIASQIRALQDIVRREGGRLRHVKPHGALYNVAVRDPSIAGAIVDAVGEVDGALAIVTLPHGALVERAEAVGIEVIPEAFADRSYRRDGTLTPRSDPGALLAREIDAADQVLWIARDGCVRAAEGEWIALRARTICVHGDGPRALAMLRTVREALRSAGIGLRAF